MADLVDRFKVVRRITLFWSLWLITETVHVYHEKMGSIETPDGVVVAAIIGILATVISFNTKAEK